MSLLQGPLLTVKLLLLVQSSLICAKSSAFKPFTFHALARLLSRPAAPACEAAAGLISSATRHGGDGEAETFFVVRR